MLKSVLTFNRILLVKSAHDHSLRLISVHTSQVYPPEQNCLILSASRHETTAEMCSGGTGSAAAGVRHERYQRSL